MILNSNTFCHQMIEDQVQVGDLVIDATTGNGNNTRFLASRVGSEGIVFSYHQSQQAANDTAASLLLTGLNERVIVYNSSFASQAQVPEHFKKQRASLAIFDYSSDADNQNQLEINYLNGIQRALNLLKHQGLLLVKFNTVPNDWEAFIDSLFAEDYQQARYQTNEITTFLIERI
ncbi:class I SAM-dependent methyltransferase [Convivina intestini]|uniref:class I SAM-dependent methyltransferase n=1 Tax=Convivina intestini TaxID=1505726 RepID=UPI002010513E|nr:class I SAM-dependent methyltransferase [Convivina intestini]CAH1850051.1 hypothetical protein R078131_00012 [Convivina intestini]